MSKPQHERYQNPLLKRDNLPLFGEGKFLRYALFAALIGGAAYAGRDVLFPSDEPAEAPITGSSTAGE